MSRDPELAHRLRLAVDAERSAHALYRARRGPDTKAIADDAMDAVDALIEEVAAP